MNNPALLLKDDDFVARSEFDDKWYLAVNIDVQKAGIDPYYHYINFGKKEGRPIKIIYKHFYVKNELDNKIIYSIFLSL